VGQVLNFKSKLVGGVAAALAVLLVVAAASYISLAHNIDDRQWVTHTYVVLEKLDELHASIIDAETATRNYLANPDDPSISEFEKGRERADRIFKELRAMTVDNATQQRALAALAPLIEGRMTELQERMKARREGGPAAALAAIQASSGKGLMNQIRQGIVNMRSEENRLLVLRSGMLEASSRKTRVVIVIGESLGFFFLFLAGMVINREMKQRALAEEEVRGLNAELERKVNERTTELANRAEELERSDLELQQFAYVASHDLQEPLRTISSFTQLLAKRYQDKLDEKAHEFIQFAVDGSKRMQTLIDDLLTFSRVGTQGKPLVPLKCDAAVDRVLKSLRATIEASGAVITRDALPVVLADESQLCQLFQNLVANAVKFRGPGVPKIHISAERDGALWKISVRDNGIGIATEHNERIFVIFQRLHTKTQYPGTGIGLAICKKIAERHGGRIWVEPSPEGGSTFCFTIEGAESEKAGERTRHGLRLSASAS
jgi:signal transduction histidine kinase